MKRKLLAMLLAVGMVSGLIAGCGGGTENTDEPQVEEAGEEKADETAEIDFMDATFTEEIGVEKTTPESMHHGYLALYPCETFNTLTLTADGIYSLEKVLQSTADSEVEIKCTYVFGGSYELGSRGKIVLQPAETCTFEESYGTLSGNSVLGNVNDKSGDETTDPLCLEYFDSNYLVRCGNAKEDVAVDLEQNTFTVTSNFEGWKNIWNANDVSTQERCAQYLIETYETRPLGEIVFYGASNFRLWENMEEDMAPYVVQNHGVGGSTDLELMQFEEELLFQFQPKVVFIQTGSNDYTQGQTMEECMANKEKMYGEFLEALPDTEFIIMAGLPLPNRSEYWDMTQELNAFIKEYCDTHERIHTIDASDVMLTDSGDESMATGDGRYFNPDIFIQDGIHLTQEGHDLWTPFMIEKLQELGIES